MTDYKRLLCRLGAVVVGFSSLMFSSVLVIAQEAVPLQPVREASISLPTFQEGEELSLDRVVAIAIQRQPDILAAQGSIAVGQSRVGQARSGFAPQVDGTVGLSRFSPDGSYANPSRSDASYGRYTAGVTVNQMLYDFGKTATRVAIQESSVNSFRADLASVEDHVIFNAKVAFFDLLTLMRKMSVAVETVTQFEKHRVQAQGFFDAGVKPKYDVTKAEVDLSNAKLNLIRAENGVRLGRVALSAAMGFSETPNYRVKDSLNFEQFPVVLEDAMVQAYDHRPDLKALLLRKKTAEQAVLLARKGDSPYLSGSVGASYGGDKFPLDEGWDVGVSLLVPVFNGNRTKHEVGEAEANLAVLAAKETGLRHQIYKEIQQGYLILHEASERIIASQLTVQQAEENYAIASGRYEAGVGNPVEVADADVLLSNARTAHVEALYEYKIAQAAIERAIGVTTVPAVM
ncbi:MAG: TolC family protein [Proteobacteria bacterium]|nr:TolC family protein [Pseudomonadota bacterium]